MRRSTWILIVVAVILNVVAQAYALPVTGYIRERSTSVNADIALRFAYFAFMLACAFVEALLFDDVVLGGSWRKRFLGGLGGRKKRSEGDESLELSDEEFEEAISTTRGGVKSLIAENSLPFFIAFFALLASNVVLFNVLNGWFDLYYSRGGHFITQLRSGNPDERCKAMLELSYKRSSKLRVDLEKVFADRLEKGTAKEKVWAAWALGYRRKLGLPAKPVRQIERGEDLLIGLLDKGSAKQQRVAVVAAARYVTRRGDDASAKLLPALRALVKAQEAADKVTLETVVALGLLREKSAVRLLGKLVLGKDRTRARVAAWALGRMQHRSALRPLLAALDKVEPEVRCEVVRAFQRLGHAAKVSKRLMDQFNRKTSDFSCPTRRIELRPDGRGKKIVDKLQLSKMSYRYRVLVLKTMAKVSFLDDALPWLKRVSENPAYHKQVRGYARSYHARLLQQIARDQ